MPKFYAHRGMEAFFEIGTDDIIPYGRVILKQYGNSVEFTGELEQLEIVADVFIDCIVDLKAAIKYEAECKAWDAAHQREGKHAEEQV